MDRNRLSQNPAAGIVGWLLALFLLQDASPVFAGDICQIDRVEKAQEGVRIFFSGRSEVSIRTQGEKWSGALIVDPNTSENQKDLAGRPVYRFVSATEGDRIVVSTGREFSCSMTVVKNDGVIGVMEFGTINVIGRFPEEFQGFIPAR